MPSAAALAMISDSVMPPPATAAPSLLIARPIQAPATSGSCHRKVCASHGRIRISTTATVKIFIDIFIGIWAFILGYIWTNHINKGPDRAKPAEIWQRFPKFILGFIVVFVVSLWLAIGSTPEIAKALPAAAGEANVFRVIFFVLTFFSIGGLSDFRKLWQQGFGKLAAVYFVSLFGFVIWVGLLISWLFFSGFKPPLA